MSQIVIPQSQANKAEWALLIEVEAVANVLASSHFAKAMTDKDIQAVNLAFSKRSLSEIRKEFARSMANLCQWSAEMNANVSSQYSTTVREYEALLWDSIIWHIYDRELAE